MGLYSDLVAAAQRVPPLSLDRAIVGPRFTAVGASPAPGGALTTGGLAYTNLGDLRPEIDTARLTALVERDARGRSLQEIARGLLAGLSPLPVPSAPARSSSPPSPVPPVLPQSSPPSSPPSLDVPPGIGLSLRVAALNALLAAAARAGNLRLGDENGLDLIARLGEGKRLAIVGRFPYLAGVRLNAARSWVLELRPEGDELPASAAPDVLPQADVVGITGSTLANGTLEGLLALCHPAAFVAIIGPTTPLSPVLFDYGVDVLCGSLVEDPAEMLASVAAGGSTRRVPGARQVSLRPA